MEPNPKRWGSTPGLKPEALTISVCLPSGASMRASIPASELKRLVFALATHEIVPYAFVELLVIGLGLEEE